MNRRLIITESDFARQKLVSGRYVPPDPNSPQCHDTIRAWLKKCSETHVDCPGSEASPLPKRVINVGSEEQEPHLYESNGETGTWDNVESSLGRRIKSYIDSAF